VGEPEGRDDDGADRRRWPRPDSAYRSSGVFVAKSVTADISVTAYEPWRRFATRSDQMTSLRNLKRLAESGG
jgi:hypothetical protein